MKKRLLLVIPVLIFSSVFCSLGGGNNNSSTPDVAGMVGGTLTAIAGQVIPSETPDLPQTGLVTGTLTYPADRLPSLRIVAYNMADDTYLYVETIADVSSYKIELPVGDYNIIAYTIGGGSFPAELAGGYTQSVLCGLSADCTDHSLVTVTVTAGVTVENINPGDWYAPVGTFPPMPK